MWLSVVDGRRCKSCEDEHGKIYAISQTPNPKPPIHPRDRCAIVPLDAKKAGTATKDSLGGADYWLKRFGHLPGYYIDRQQAENLGWNRGKKKLHQVAPGKMLFGGIYRNDDGHLPEKPGRIWMEADINYTSGKRGRGRVLFSNDDLIFVTYDHYETFIEIV